MTEPSTTLVDFSSVTLPFDAGDLLSSGAELFGVVAGFVLLALAFVVVPKIVRIIRGAFGTSRA